MLRASGRLGRQLIGVASTSAAIQTGGRVSTVLCGAARTGLVSSRGPSTAISYARSLTTSMARESSRRLAQSAFSTKGAENLSTWQRLKEMIKNYWYIAIPVHAVNCVVWFSALYALVASGVDVVGILERSRLFPQAIIQKVRESPNLGTFAVVALLYKVLLPVKMLMSVWLATLAIRYLSRRGYITTTQALRIVKQRRIRITKKMKQQREEMRRRWGVHRERFHRSTGHRFKRRQK